MLSSFCEKIASCIQNFTCSGGAADNVRDNECCACTCGCCIGVILTNIVACPLLCAKKIGWVAIVTSNGIAVPCTGVIFCCCCNKHGKCFLPAKQESTTLNNYPILESESSDSD